jgi:large subunit ribosomal protein L32
MAVPKKKTSHSRGGLRKGGNGAYTTKFANVVTDKTTGEYKLPHHVSADGYYNGKKVIATKKDKKASAEKEE